MVNCMVLACKLVWIELDTKKARKETGRAGCQVHSFLGRANTSPIRNFSLFDLLPHRHQDERIPSIQSRWREWMLHFRIMWAKDEAAAARDASSL